MSETASGSVPVLAAEEARCRIADAREEFGRHMAGYEPTRLSPFEMASSLAIVRLADQVDVLARVVATLAAQA